MNYEEARQIPDEELAERLLASLWARGMMLVPVAAWDDIEAEAARLRGQLEAVDERLAEREEEIERLRSALDSMTRQFAYWSSRAIGYATGGLSALEEAFLALGWEDPHPAPEACCEVAGCSSRRTTVHHGRRLCGDHWRKAELGEEADR